MGDLYNVKVVSLVEPKTAINMSLGPEKVVIYVIAGRSHYRDPWPLIYIGEHSGPGKSGRYLRMVVLSDRSFSGTLPYRVQYFIVSWQCFKQTHLQAVLTQLLLPIPDMSLQPSQYYWHTHSPGLTSELNCPSVDY